MELDLRLSRKDEAAVLNFFQDAFSKGVKVPDSLSGLWNDLSYKMRIFQKYTADSCGSGSRSTRGEDFPILYEDHQILVYNNPSGEIFVEKKGENIAAIRISPDSDGLVVTSQSANFTPWSVNGLPAFLVRGGK